MNSILVSQLTSFTFIYSMQSSTIQQVRERFVFRLWESSVVCWPWPLTSISETTPLCSAWSKWSMHNGVDLLLGCLCSVPVDFFSWQSVLGQIKPDILHFVFGWLTKTPFAECKWGALSALPVLQPFLLKWIFTKGKVNLFRYKLGMIWNEVVFCQSKLGYSNT